MRCGRCGEEVPEGARFCAQCGAPLATSAPPSLVGRVIAGRYRLVRQVAEGGMGTVYEAEQSLGTSRRAVAVKLLGHEYSDEPTVRARFLREAGTIAKLEHFNTVRVYDFGATEDGTLYIVMEYLEGRTLAAVLAAEGALPIARVEHIVTQIAASLEEAHALGITHRDLKPANILLLESYAAQRDVVKLVDFGIAQSERGRDANAATKLTELGVCVGTPAYMSPEQFTGGTVDPRSDIYSLGVTTYEMLSGRLPFTAQSALAWAQAHINGAPAPLGEDHGAGPIPEPARRAVARSLSKDPAERQPSAMAFARELGGKDTAARTAELVEAAKVKTDPMQQYPDFSAPAPATSGMPRTLPMGHAAGSGREAPSPAGARRRGGVLGWLALALVACASLSLLVLGVNGRLGLLRSTSGSSPPPPSTSVLGASAEPEPVTIEPLPIEPAPATPKPAPRPPPSRPRPTPPSSRPAPPTPPPEAAPSPGAAGAPSAPALPGATPAAPGAGGAPVLPGSAPPGTSPLPPPSPTTPPVPGASPLPPWGAVTVGACARCLEELRGRAHYAVVTAVAQSLLCEDTVERMRCEAQIRELAPGLAEQAAREGNCPAALATLAAAANLGVPRDRFDAVQAQCLR